MLEWVAIPSQGIFPTQGLNPGLLYYRQILYHLSQQRLSMSGALLFHVIVMGKNKPDSILDLFLWL